MSTAQLERVPQFGCVCIKLWRKRRHLRRIDFLLDAAGAGGRCFFCVVLFCLVFRPFLPTGVHTLPAGLFHLLYISRRSFTFCALYMRFRSVL